MTSSRTALPVATQLTRLAACFSVMFGVSHKAMATTVTDCSDGGGANTLRKILANAASGDIISVSQCSLITLSNGELSSSNAKVRIQGNGTNVISGNNTNRIIKHTGTGGYLAFHDVTLQNGRYVGLSALGGCIYSTSPSVRLYNTIVKNCAATETDLTGNARGAGIYALGHVELRDSTVSGNTATQQSTQLFRAEGGGIYANSVSAYNSTISNNTTQSTAGITSSEYTQGGGILATTSAKIYSCTLSGNSAGKYGAMKLGSGVNMVDSTISGNSAVHRTGGLGLQGPSTIANSTIAFNSSSEANGPAGLRTSDVLKLQSTIISNSSYGSLAAKDVGGTGSIDPASANNLIMSSALAVPADTIHEDPRLLPLANNGGPTRTHALDQESPAIDRGNAVFNFSNFVPVSCDQRGNPGHELNPPNTYNCGPGGYVRTDTDPKHSKPDIGAFEVQFPIDDWIFFDGFGF